VPHRSRRRYERQLELLGPEAQERLEASRVAIVGLGGLGSNVALNLAALGVGSLILIDYDTVGLSNLNRQLLYTEADVGLPKVEAASRRFREFRSDLRIEAYRERLDRGNARALIRDVDVVVDALDSWESRLALADAAWESGIPLVHGAVDGFYGQVTTIERGRSICLYCIAPPELRPARPPQAIVTTVTMTAAIQASEVLKLITGLGEPSYNRLVVIDSREPRIDYIQLKEVSCEDCKRLPTAQAKP
jgi:molybdopterin/thiamine biosynthesis adenylyltransferase